MHIVSPCTAIRFDNPRTSFECAVTHTGDYFRLCGEVAVVQTSLGDNRYIAEYKMPESWDDLYFHREDDALQTFIKVVLLVTIVAIPIILFVAIIVKFNEIALNILKFLSYLTVIIPLIMLIINASLRSKITVLVND